MTEVVQAAGGWILAEVRMWLGWTLGGAVVGAVGLGGTGLYLIGLQGLMLGAAVGAVVGGIAGLVFIVLASSQSIFH